MRVIVSGSSGLIGTALVAQLRSAGHSVTRLVRNGRRASAAERVVLWSPDRGTIEAEMLEGHDAVVNLAGESLLALWTPTKKAAIRESRVRGTTLLARTIAGLQQPPRVFVSASASGYYGIRPGREPLDESASRGSGFLADVVSEWEAAAQAAGTVARVVTTRFGLVLSPKGGTLATMLLPFRLGLGGRVGTGEQTWSWITLDDVVHGLLHVLNADQLTGAVNFAAPNAVSNREFTEILGRVLHRPTVMVAPAFVIRMLGDMGKEMLLNDATVVPSKLLQSGYRFKFPLLEPGLKALLA
jgi:uncharacterized protein (TIGR01777 family)